MVANSTARLFEDMLRLSRVSAHEKAVVLVPHIYNEQHLSASITALSDIGTDFYTMILPPLAEQGRLVLPSSDSIYDALQGADFILTLDQSSYCSLAPPSFKLIYGSERGYKLLEKGTRSLSLMIPEPAMRRLWPTEAIVKRSYAGARILEKGEEIRLTSKAGTDLSMSKKNRKGSCQVGIADEPGRWDNFGFGSVATAPLEDSAKGTLVLEPGDYIVTLETMVTDAVKCTLKDGRITKIEGGVSATLIRKYLEYFKDPEACGTSHIGWGTHDQACWSPPGGAVADEVLGYVMDRYNYYGAIAIAFGWNLLRSPAKHCGLHGGRGGNAHLDIELLNHDLYLDDQLICSAGQIVNPECK